METVNLTEEELQEFAFDDAKVGIRTYKRWRNRKGARILDLWQADGCKGEEPPFSPAWLYAVALDEQPCDIANASPEEIRFRLYEKYGERFTAVKAVEGKGEAADKSEELVQSVEVEKPESAEPEPRVEHETEAEVEPEENEVEENEVEESTSVGDEAVTVDWSAF